MDVFIFVQTSISLRMPVVQCIQPVDPQKEFLKFLFVDEFLFGDPPGEDVINNFAVCRVVHVLMRHGASCKD